VESHKVPLAGLVLQPSPCSIEPVAYRRKEAVVSKAWAKQFGSASAFPTVLADPPYAFVGNIRRLALTPPQSTMTYPNANNEPTTLQVELWSNSYRVFVLLWVPQRERMKRRRIIVPGTGVST